MLLRAAVAGRAPAAAGTRWPRVTWREVWTGCPGLYRPSDDPTPSKEDIHLTRQLVEGARLLGLRIHDRVIIGHGRHMSLAQRGVIYRRRRIFVPARGT